MTDKPLLTFVIEPELLQQIDKFWHKNQFKSRAAAVKWLLRWALTQKPKMEDDESV